MSPLDLAPRSRFGRLLWQLIPGTCVLCDQPSALPIDLCAVCLADLPWNESACTQCGLPLGSSNRLVCAACTARPPPFSRTIAPLRYDAVVAALVHALKFRRSLVHGRVMATILQASVQRAYSQSRPLPEQDCDASERPSIVVPVPLSLRRLLRRGHNQAATIARRVGAELDLPVRYDRLRRIRHTSPQTGLSRRERLRNLAGAFEHRGVLAGETVAIVDDVVTTGATVRAVARCLRRAGAGAVHVWAVARTDRDAL